MGRNRWGLPVVLVALATGALIIAGGLGGAASARGATLRLRITGSGTVSIHPGNRRCTRRCVMHVASGAPIALTAHAAWGNQLARWLGACSAHPHRARCVVRASRATAVHVRFAQITQLQSWNPFYRCKPTVTTIPFILGSQKDAAGGATEAGGRFQPHLRGSEDQHLLRPPCQVGGAATFVEIHDVVVSESAERSGDGDEVVNLVAPNRPDITDGYMKTIHTEIDNTLISHHVAPLIQPPKGTHIDIQGFVFWDPAHTDAEFHSFSGWEIHTLTAWRLSRPR